MTRPALTLPLRATALLTLAALSACVSNPPQPDRNAKAEVKETVGEIVMPARFNVSLLQKTEKGEKPKLYTQVRGMGDASNEKLLFPKQVAETIGITPVQVQRRFMDTIGKTKRYEVYDSSTSVTAEASDYVVDAQFVSSTQELRQLEGGVRVTVSQVQINANLINRYTGKPVWDAPVEAVGRTGGSSSDRISLQRNENLNDPAVQRKLGIDYERAMQRAFDALARRIDTELRPMGKVLGTEGDGITILGGQRTGLQRGDELVVFAATITRVGAEQEFINLRPLAAIRCNGVGAGTSQCDVIRRNPRQALKVGDFVVLTDHSADDARSAL